VKASLENLKYNEFDEAFIRTCLYRPFTRKKLYFDDFWNEERYRQPMLFPTGEAINVAICLTVLGSEKPFMVLVTNVIPDLHLVGAGCGTQCFPYYTYAEDGSSRRENITDWALSQFQAKYGPEVTKWHIFHYVYAMLHHPQYREHYAENLKRDLPHIPLLHRKEAFLACVRIGQQLIDIHLRYEQAKEYPLKWVENNDVPFSWHVEKMKLAPDKAAVIVNGSLTLAGIPQECFACRLGNRSALEWVIDQYQVSIDKRSGIVSDWESVLVREEEKMGIPCEIPNFTCFVYTRGLCLKSHERRGNRLYLIIFKPHWLLELCSLQSNEVKTKRLLNIIGNGINRLNCPIESPERAVTGHLYRTACWIDVLLLHTACLLSWGILACRSYRML